jgi:hypothetical protein
MEIKMTSESLSNAATLLYAIWRNPQVFNCAEIALIGALEVRAIDACQDVVQVSRAALIQETGLAQGSVIRAICSLKKVGVISRRKVGHKVPHVYTINRDAIKRLSR